MEVTAYELEAEFSAAQHNVAKFDFVLTWSAKDGQTFTFWLDGQAVHETSNPYEFLQGLNAGLRLGGKKVLDIVEKMSEFVDTMEV